MQYHCALNQGTYESNRGRLRARELPDPTLAAEVGEGCLNSIERLGCIYGRPTFHTHHGSADLALGKCIRTAASPNAAPPSVALRPKGMHLYRITVSRDHVRPRRLGSLLEQVR